MHWAKVECYICGDVLHGSTFISAPVHWRAPRPHCSEAVFARRASTVRWRKASGADGAASQNELYLMSDVLDNLDLHLYLAHFPHERQHIEEGTAKAIDGLAAALVRIGARVKVVCEGPASIHKLSPVGYEISCFSPTDMKRYVAQLNGNALWVLNGMFHRRVYAMSRLLYRRGVRYIVAPHDP